MQLAFMLDIGLKVLSKLKEMPFRKNYLHYFSVVLSPKTITFGEKMYLEAIVSILVIT